MSTVELSSCDHGVVAKVKRCIMERDLYPRRWGLGPVALEKKKMKSDGKLDVSICLIMWATAPTNTAKKYGRPNEATPAKWQKDYQDFNAPLENGTSVPIKLEDKPPAGADIKPADAGSKEIPLKQPEPEAANDEVDSKKRKRHEGETPEEKADRKRKKKEKKEKRKLKKGQSDDGSE